MERVRKTVAVIGGGLTGLSTAYYLEKKAKEQGEDVRIVLLEGDDRLGGKIMTDTREGYVIELGPDSFLGRKPAAVNLARDLGMAHELVGTNQDPKAKKTYILHDMQLHRIPPGLNIGIPTQFTPFATTTLLTLAGKMRAGLDLFIPRSQHTGDQSLGTFLERRLGTEVVDRMVEPLLAGIYAGDMRKLSLRSTFPQFEQLEQKYGSLIRGMLEQAKNAKKQPVQPEYGAAPVGDANAHAPKLPNSVFFTFRGGLEYFIGRIASALQHTEIRLSTRVETIEQQVGTGYQVRLADGETFDVDTVVVTTPTYQAAKLFPRHLKTNSHLTQLPHATVATVVLAYDQDQLDHPLDGTGFVVRKTEPTTITACTWTSSKWLHTAPEGKRLIRCYVGRSGDDAVVHESDEEIVRRVRQDLKKVMGLNAEPKFTIVTRLRESMPQYYVGHLDRVKAFKEQAAAELPGVFFIGMGYDGVGIPDCISQSIQAADQTLNHMKNQPIPARV